MPTSSENQTPNPPRLEGEHWDEFVATLSLEVTEEFADWISEDLARLEEKLQKFVSPASQMKSLCR